MLPYIQTQDLTLSKLQTTWASQLNPVLALPLNQGILLQDVALSSGTNTVNHRLGRNLQGWIVVRIRANATIFDTQDSNQMPNLTLQLTASADAVVDLLVF